MNIKTLKNFLFISFISLFAATVQAQSSFIRITKEPIPDYSDQDDSLRLYVQANGPVYIQWENGQRENLEGDDFSLLQTMMPKSNSFKLVGNITALNCRQNNLTVIDADHDPVLQNLDCSFNPLFVLNLLNNKELRTLNSSYCCDVEKMSEGPIMEDEKEKPLISILDLSENEKLQEVDCSHSFLKQLILPDNAPLKRLDCSHNYLSALRASNQSLRYLDCSYNWIKALRIKEATELKNLICNFNALRHLDLSFNRKLLTLDCASNQLSELKLPSSSSLMYISCYNNHMEGASIDTLISSLPQGHWENQEIPLSRRDYIMKPITYKLQGCVLDINRMNPYLDQDNYCDSIQIKQIRAKQWRLGYIDTSYLPYQRMYDYMNRNNNDESLENNESDLKFIPIKAKTFPRYRYDHYIMASALPNALNGNYFGIASYARSPEEIVWEDGSRSIFYEIMTDKIGGSFSLIHSSSFKIYGNFISMKILPSSFLQSIECHKQRELKEFILNNNYNLSHLDISELPVLQYLDCSFTNLANLNTSKNKQLRFLEAYSIPLKQLDLSKNNKLNLVALGCNNFSVSQMQQFINLLPDRKGSNASKEDDFYPFLCLSTPSEEGSFLLNSPVMKIPQNKFTRQQIIRAWQKGWHFGNVEIITNNRAMYSEIYPYRRKSSEYHTLYIDIPF